MHTPLLVYVVYDGIQNSVFEGQVVAPLLKKIEAGLYEKIIIVSFEQSISKELKKQCETLSAYEPHLTCIVYKRPRFINSLFLWKQAYQLKALLMRHTHYDLMARGPLAGYIAKKATTLHCENLTIQARGLLAQEHRYSTKTTSKWKKPLHAVRALQLQLLEQEAYIQPLTASYTFHIESVSPALQQELVSAYQLPTTHFVTSEFDEPTCLSVEQRLHFRTLYRTQLQIPVDAPVYAYNGSLKPWQCPESTITFFKQEYAKNNKALFLALTTEPLAMKQWLTSCGVCPDAYRILQVEHAEVIPHLCAADYGFLLREPHLMNWISRPTKMLEYKAAGLTIIHNNSIALLTEKH